MWSVFQTVFTLASRVKIFLGQPLYKKDWLRFCVPTLWEAQMSLCSTSLCLSWVLLQSSGWNTAAEVSPCDHSWSCQFPATHDPAQTPEWFLLWICSMRWASTNPVHGWSTLPTPPGLWSLLQQEAEQNQVNQQFHLKTTNQPGPTITTYWSFFSKTMPFSLPINLPLYQAMLYPSKKQCTGSILHGICTYPVLRLWVFTLQSIIFT